MPYKVFDIFNLSFATFVYGVESWFGSCTIGYGNEIVIKLILVLLLSAVEFGWVQNASGRAEGTIVAIGGGGGEIGIGRQLLENGACVDEEAVKDIGGEAELRENQATLLLPVAVPRASARHEVDVEVDFASESGAAGVDGRRQGDVLHGIELQLILCSAAEEGVVKGEDVHDVLHAPLFLRHWHRPSCTPTTNCSQNSTPHLTTGFPGHLQ
uniref:Uncharacterized protein n=1 Tax=Oryza glumipatula TaxID=40148 RepID=A0A0E0A3Y0_9ORYZ